MGLLKLLGKISGGLLFTLFLSLFVLCIVMLSITEYSNAEEIFTDVYVKAVKSQMGEQQIKDLYNAAVLACENKENITVPLGNESMTFSCSDITSSNSTDIPYLVARKSFNVFYYKDYGCDFLDCVQNIKSPEDATIFFSSTGNAFFNKLLLYVIAGTIISGLILLASIETWMERFQAFGSEFLFIGVMYFLIPYGKQFATQQFPAEVRPIVDSIVDLVFSSVSKILLIFFIAGLLLIAIVLINKYFPKKKEE